MPVSHLDATMIM